jgi:hypothetical protein
MDAWNGWYHVNGNTYGTWLPGDRRGWHAKRHKKHVEGDYRKPPPQGSGDPLYNHARGLLKQPPVHLAPTERQAAGQALVEMLLDQQTQVIVLALDAVHFHFLAKLPDKRVRPKVARAKKHATFTLRDSGPEGRVWAQKSKVTPITDRQHQLSVFKYICRHQGKGAWLWTFREGVYWSPTIRR